MDGFDASGRPREVSPRTIASRSPLILPGSGTNWYPPSFSASTSLFYIPAWERGTVGGIMQRPSAAYGALRAFDPQTGKQKWEFRRDNAIFSSGVLSTASGLLFTGVSGDYYSGEDAARLADGYFYALDARSGNLLWQMALPWSVTSGPMSYSVAGKQFVAVAAGNTLFVFALRQ
jgi:alcohol dehydrogenase (cytochrome c)